MKENNILTSEREYRYMVSSVAGYAKVAPIARRVKRGDAESISRAAVLMKEAVRAILPRDKLVVLVPIPNRSGKAGYTKQLANEIGAAMDIPVIDALESNPHRPIFEVKKEGLPPESLELHFWQKAVIPQTAVPILIDNVLDTGHTAIAAYKALGREDTLMAVLGDTHKFRKNQWKPSIYPLISDFMAKKKTSEAAAPKVEKQQEKKQSATEQTMADRYMQLKERHPDSILLFRSGDNYKALNSDATKVATILNTPVEKLKHKKDGFQQTTFPHQKLDTFLPKLIRAGLRIAIVDSVAPRKKVEEKTAIQESTAKTQSQAKEQKSEKEQKQEAKTETKAKTSTKEKAKAEVKTEEKTANKVVANAVEQKTEVKQQHEPRPPQLVTVNGDKVTHGHAFQSTQSPENWYFTARLNGTQLRPMKMEASDVEAYQKKESSIEGLMTKYYPTKMEKKVTPEEYKADNKLSDGRTVDRLFVYKEKDTARDDYGKYKIYAEVGEQKMSRVMSVADQNAFFDRVTTQAKLVEKNFGEKLHLASAYSQYKLPEGADVKDIRVAKDRNDGKWKISAAVGENGRTEKKTLSYDDGYSLFQAKTVTREQLAAKYLTPEINMLASQKHQVSQGMKI